MLRTVMFHCFGLKSSSIYRKDMGGNPSLEALVGHFERQGDRFEFGDMPIWLLKRHGPPVDAAPALYVIRNGRDATSSLFDFYPKRDPSDLLEGKVSHFGTWADNVRSWSPRTRPKTLLLRYEDMVSDLSGVIDQISDYIGIEAVQRTIPGREELAAVEGRWIRRQTVERKAALSGALLDRFWEINGEVMREYGYA